MRVAVVFPGQGTQAPGMGAPWHDHPAWKIVEQAEAAFGEPLAPLLLDAPAEQLARTARSTARGAVHVARRMGSRAADARRRRRVRGSFARPGDRAHRVGSARPRRRRAIRGPARRAHAGRGRRAPGPHGRAARRRPRAGRRRVHRRARWRVGRQRQRARPGRHRGYARRRRGRGRPRQGDRRAPGTAPQRRRRVPHSADGLRRATVSSTRSPRSDSRRRARPSSRTTTARPYGADDIDGWRTRLADHVTVAGPVAHFDGDARRPRRRRVRRGRTRLDDRRRRQAHRSRRSRPRVRHSRRLRTALPPKETSHDRPARSPRRASCRWSNA